eukprot:TRINITY_DN16431_c0_g1_i7.p2 TRINITY_DN16431_c0_g1~~TRINITY_DN16431_c0_g1_i7.p2  ORF type:complete len:102 (-),score=14.27 TRINITY_DN16431_c0_g1_i7:168-473(-)
MTPLLTTVSVSTTSFAAAARRCCAQRHSAARFAGSTALSKEMTSGFQPLCSRSTSCDNAAVQLRSYCLPAAARIARATFVPHHLPCMQTQSAENVIIVQIR